MTLCMCLQAAILTGRRSKTGISLKEIDDSVDRIVAGMEGTPMVDSKSKSLVAYHEVGHAICGTLTPGLSSDLPLVSNVPCPDMCRWLLNSGVEIQHLHELLHMVCNTAFNTLL